ncbi:MAG: TonB-dependent receptor, partial [Planctomycetes bacterium]|nr:TonB-dependent receptor [Planctomycetota bacterium]
LSRRLTELGPRIIESNSKYTRLLAGLRGALAGSWDYDAWVSYTRGDEEELAQNDGSYSRLQQGLLVDPVSGNCFDTSNGCVPLDLFGEGNLSSAGADFIGADPYLTTIEREQLLASAFVRGTLFALPAGDVASAFGVEWRRDSGDLEADQALFTGDTLGFIADSNVAGEETVYEMYAEALVPLLSDLPLARYLGLELGGRLSSYDNAGDLETWKLGADWEPVNGLRLRTMYQRSARAPNLAEAFLVPFEQNGTVVGFDPREDPCSASADPVGNGLADVCIAQGIPADELGSFEATLQFPVLFTDGGNPMLAPEIAETLTAGFVFSRFDTWAISVDYFRIDVEDTIGSSDPMLVCWDDLNTERSTCDRIRRDPGTYDINAVDRTAANLGKLKTDGIDTQFDFSTELAGWLAPRNGYAYLDVNVAWTHVLQNSTQGDAATTTLDCVGKFGAACGLFGNDTVVPENRVRTSVAWSTERLRFQVAWRWIDGTDNSVRDVAPAFGVPVELVNPAIQSIGSTSYVDLSADVDLNDHLALGLTVANILLSLGMFMLSPV